MSLIDINNVAPVLTAKIPATRIKRQVNQVYDRMVQDYNQGMQLFWGNPNFTPNEIYDELGVALAVQVFTLNASLRDAILAADPTQVLKSAADYGFSYTVDETTGALTVTTL